MSTLANPRSTSPLAPDPIFTPSAETISASRLTAFIRFCAQATGREIIDSEELYRLSVEDFRLFWLLFLRFSKLTMDGDTSPVCTGESVEAARFFPKLQLNYAENLLVCNAPEDSQRPAVTAVELGGVTETLTRGELRQRVFEFAGALRALGVRPGDRVVSVLRNDAGSVVAALGSAAVGATFSSAAPGTVVSSLVSRFGQLEPVVLIVSSIGDPGFESERLRELARGLATLRAVVVLDDGPIPPGFSVPVHRGSELALGLSKPGEWTRYPFNHPLYILFSSGTTGIPKCIVHGAGGTLLEHMKEHVLHGDLRCGDKLFFHTSASWMMWNWQLSALACSAEIVLYDGPAVDPATLWNIVAQEHVTVFGTSPAYLRLCQTAGYSPMRELDLSSLRSIMSTGEILHDDQFEWARDNVRQIPVQSISGGTDIVGCFVLGNPNLPVYAGESQCRSFGLDVRVLALDGTPPGSLVGELVCAQPFPSCPLGIYGDASGERFHATYFSQNPGVWTHGDLVEITSRGTARMHGRSDGTMNVRGIRIGPSEIYSVLGSFTEIQESIVVEQPTPGRAGDSRMVLLVVMSQGHLLDPRLRARIRTAIAHHASPAHIPAVIIDVPDLPLTHSAKRSEVAARDALKGERSTNMDALQNPDCLQEIAARVVAHDSRAATQTPKGAQPAGTLEAELTRIWEQVLGVSPVDADDDFFEIGGTSLLTAALFQQIADRLARRLPLSTILAAPTVSSMTALLRDDTGEAWGPLELLKRGDTQRPLFMAPGLLGETLGLRPLAHHIDTDRAVYGMRGRGLMDGEQPLDRVEDMADVLVDSVRGLQPHGPYSLLGFSLGGLIVVEIARRLLDAGERVEFLGMIDTHSSWCCLNRRERLGQLVRLPLRWPRAITVDMNRTIRLVEERLGIRPPVAIARDQSRAHLRAASRRAQKNYRPQPYPGPIVFFSASLLSPVQVDATMLWSRIASDLTVHQVPGNHNQLIHEPSVLKLSRAIAVSLPPHNSSASLHEGT